MGMIAETAPITCGVAVNMNETGLDPSTGSLIAKIDILYENGQQSCVVSDLAVPWYLVAWFAAVRLKAIQSHGGRACAVVLRPGPPLDAFCTLY